MTEIGRNDPCPCGSGKKYKKCCLDKEHSVPIIPGREERIRLRLVEDIKAFCGMRHKDGIAEAYDYFWNGLASKEFLRTPEVYDAGIINFSEWLIYDWRPEKDDGTMVELYAESMRSVAPEEHGVLHKMAGAFISLYEVQEVFPEKGLRLKDLFTGTEYDVKERMATRSLHKWDVFATRLVLIDGSLIMTGCAYPYHRRDKDWIIKHIKKCFKDYQAKNSGASMAGFLKRNGVLFNYYWCDCMLNPAMPKICTTSGEAVIFSKAVFEIKDTAGVISGLKEIKEFNEIDECRYQWLDEEKSDGMATLLGSVAIKNDKLYLECHSRERLERGKALIAERLSGSIEHKTDVLQDPLQAIKHYGDAPKHTKGNKIPKDIEQELCDRFMREHYDKWVNERLPALKGKTPVEAVKTPAGRKKVVDLLKSIENMEDRKKRDGEPYSDISWLWERLGLEK